MSAVRHGDTINKPICFTSSNLHDPQSAHSSEGRLITIAKPTGNLLVNNNKQLSSKKIEITSCTIAIENAPETLHKDFHSLEEPLNVNTDSATPDSATPDSATPDSATQKLLYSEMVNTSQPPDSSLSMLTNDIDSLEKGEVTAIKVEMDDQLPTVNFVSAPSLKSGNHSQSSSEMSDSSNQLKELDVLQEERKKAQSIGSVKGIRYLWLSTKALYKTKHSSSDVIGAATQDAGGRATQKQVAESGCPLSQKI
ncbi:hypothetical protein [Endozoicomonas ascidiicola]|uniref:hypothetical protein n=1 Tax=Endozoicomonas ascidiicola TaxID=1698521 RepID=UPI0008363BDE|nr:hypothetical protein [Endozoicomonas ascidiicola]